MTYPSVSENCTLQPVRTPRGIAPWVRLVRETTAGAPDRPTLRSPRDGYAVLAQRLASEEQEVFVVMALDSKSGVLASAEVTRGTLNQSLVHPREVFRYAIAFGAAGVIVAHNHPSGDPTPSADDRAVTRQLVDAGKLLGIPVFDHLIIGNGRYVSFAESGLL